MPAQPPPLLDMIRDLIAAPSVSSVSHRFDQSNRKVVDLLASWLADFGFKVDIQAVPGHYGKVNLIAVLGSGPGGLVLAGHTDTVPFDEHRWRFDPFSATQQNGRLYGLGTADMKSFLALAVEAARGFNAGNLKRPLIILATADEESGMAGARALAEAGAPLGRYAIIGEPTGLRPVRMHKGVMMEAIRLQGRSGHSSDPSLGVNALEGMYEVIGELMQWREELRACYANPLFKVPSPTLNFGCIRGGDNPNRICGECELQIDMRPLPGMNPEELQHALKARIGEVFNKSEIEWSVDPLFKPIEGLETAADSPLVSACEHLTGCAAEAVAFGTEGPFLTRLGMDTVILGPGHIEQAHKPDEYLELDMLDPALDLLKGLIVRFCANAGHDNG